MNGIYQRESSLINKKKAGYNMKSSPVKNFFYRMLCGFFIGISIIAPGVSGSVIAVIMGIYDKLIGIISNPFKNFKQNVVYVMPLGIGALLSMLSLVKFFDWLFESYPGPAFMLFVGLIAGSLPTVFKEGNEKGFKKSYTFGIVFAFLFAGTIGTLGMMAKPEVTSLLETVVHNLTNTSGAAFNISADSIIYLTVCGFIAGMTSMIPGMSISMMLMVLGAYTTLLNAASAYDVFVIAPVGIAFVAGMLLFSKVTNHVFKKYKSLAYFMVFGFMIGSLISIFPTIEADAFIIIFSLLMIAGGLFISLLFQKMGKKLGREEIA